MHEAVPFRAPMQVLNAIVTAMSHLAVAVAHEDRSLALRAIDVARHEMEELTIARVGDDADRDAVLDVFEACLKAIDRQVPK